MSEMKPCMLCGVTQSGVDKPNKEYKSLVKMVLQTSNEKQLVNLIKIMSERITLCVGTSLGPNLLAYEDEELYNVEVISEASNKLKKMLETRTDGTGLDSALHCMDVLKESVLKVSPDPLCDFNLKLSAVFDYLDTQETYREIEVEFN